MVLILSVPDLAPRVPSRQQAAANAGRAFLNGCAERPLCRNRAYRLRAARRYRKTRRYRCAKHRPRRHPLRIAIRARPVGRPRAMTSAAITAGKAGRLFRRWRVTLYATRIWPRSFCADGASRSCGWSRARCPSQAESGSSRNSGRSSGSRLADSICAGILPETG